MLRQALVIAVAILAAPVAVSAAEAGPLDGLTEVGRGELRWLGFEVYDAHLYTASGLFEGIDAAPVALEIRYEREIPARKLVETTAREWRRLGPALGVEDDPRTRRWLETVGGIWPDVGPGDRILTVLGADGVTRFYGNDGLLGTVADPAFGPAFLAIWLHPDTRAADLRADLIGATE